MITPGSAPRTLFLPVPARGLDSGPYWVILERSQAPWLRRGEWIIRIGLLVAWLTLAGWSLTPAVN